MRLAHHIKFTHLKTLKQRGLVLFLALVALVVLSLAAVALIRSVDTSTLIAGNLAFKQAATTSADAGVDAAITLLANMRDSNGTKNVYTDDTHTFNITDLTARPGYFSYADPTLSLTTDATWDDVNDNLVGTDASGNTVRYIIQRMCRNNNRPIQTAECLFSAATEDNNGQQVKLPKDICDGAGCPVAGQTPQIRVTVRVTGPKNTVSYVQAFVY